VDCVRKIGDICRLVKKKLHLDGNAGSFEVASGKETVIGSTHNKTHQTLIIFSIKAGER
jgi:hypothetical protein